MPFRANTTDLGVGGNSRDSLFWWTVFLICLAGVGIGCWVGSFYVFGHPERPKPYRILTRLGKLSPPTRFLVTKAPPGEFWGAQRVFEQYSKFTTLQLERENEILFRNYLRNYSENKRPVRYLTGTFTILKAYELQDSDLITSGVVALSQAEEFPQLLVELIYPTPRENVPALLQMLSPGLGVKLEKTLDLSAILHVGLTLDGRLQVTAMPLLYGSYAVRNGTGSFSLQPPPSVNVPAGFPLVRGEEVRSVLFDQQEARRKRLVSKGPMGPEPANGPQLVRMNPELAAEGAPAASSALAVPVPSAVIASNGAAELAALASSNAPSRGESKGDGGAMESKVSVGDPSSEKGGDKISSKKKGSGDAVPNPEEPVVGVPVSQAAGKSVEAQKKAVAAIPVKPGTGTAAVVPAENAPSSKSRIAETNPVAAAFAAAPAPHIQTVPNPGVVVAQPVQASKALAKTSKEAPSKEAGVAAAKGETIALARNYSSGVPVPAGTPPLRANAPSSGETKAFVAAAPVPIPAAPAGNWKTYGSGQQPGGRVVSTEQATAYADRTDTGRLYLRGQFVVTATGNGRAVLRQARSDDRSPPARVIVEYPAGSVPPAQGSSIARDDGRGFEIREVRKSPDGQVNIYVREISAP